MIPKILYILKGRTLRLKLPANRFYLKRLCNCLFIFLALNVGFIDFSCVSASRWATEIDWPDINANNLPEQNDYPDAEAVVLIDEGEVKIHLLPEHSFSTYTRHSVTKIFNSRGHHLANIVIPYSGKSTIDQIEARTISPDGKITPLDEETIFDVNLYPNFVFYSDQRAKIFTLPAVEDGCIIEYRYSMTISSQTYGNYWRFQSNLPVMLSRFTLIKPAEWELDYRLYDLNIEPQTILLADGLTKSVTWQVRDQDPIENEIAMPSLNEIGARLALRSVGVSSWQDIAKWYRDLFDPQMAVNDEMEQTVAALLQDVSDDSQKLRIIFEWVRDQVRYIAVSIGIGGYQPHPAADVILNRYGDCKDMATLLCSLAETAGINVQQALISTRQNGLPDTTLPSAAHFNHVIAYAPDLGPGGLWMDATEKTCPFGQLPWYDQAMPALVINRDGKGDFIMTPATSADRNTSKMTFDINLKTDCTAEISGTFTAFGTVANEMREQFYNASYQELKEWFQLYLAERFVGAKLDSMKISGQKPVTDPLQIRFGFSCPQLAREIDKDMIILPENIVRFNLADYFRTNQRMQDIHLQFASTREVSFSVRIPANWQVKYVPETDSLVSDYAKSVRQTGYSQTSIAASYLYRLSKSKISALEYHEYQSVLDQISALGRDEIILERIRQ